MDTSFKSRSFKFVYWIMLIVAVLDTLDTFNRFIVGYFTSGVMSVPGVGNVELTTTTFLISIIMLLAIIYGIYLLYKLKKAGGYWILGASLLGQIVWVTIGPFAGHLSSAVLQFITVYFAIMIIVVIGIPWFYSDKFE